MKKKKKLAFGAMDSRDGKTRKGGKTGNVETLHAEIDQLEAPIAKLTDDATESTNAWRQPKHDELKCIFIKPRLKKKKKKKLAFRARASRERKIRKGGKTGNVETLHAEIDQLGAPIAKLTEDTTESGHTVDGYPL